MPKVGKTTIQVGNKRETFDIYYSSSKGFYLKDFPQQMISTVDSTDRNSSSHYYNTESELISAMENVMRRYYEITSSTKRVILVKVGYGIRNTMNRTGLGSYTGIAGKPRSIGNPRFGGEAVNFDWGVSFEWDVFVLVSSSVDKLFMVMLDDNYEETERSKYAREYRSESIDGYMIDWTPERHEFFKNMERAMQSLGDKMMDFFKKKDNMIELIDSRGFKLING